MIPTQILRVLSTMRQHDVPALLMGGQACVLYGAAEYSRDLDLAVLATPSALAQLTASLHSLGATVIAVPPFAADFLARGHAVHFSVPDEGESAPLRVDVMSVLRGVAPFELLWERRTTLALAIDGADEVLVDVMSLDDLVQAKKTQRDKDWPMIRRLVDASYATECDDAPSPARIAFWLEELRSPEFLRDAAARFPAAAAASSRAAVRAVLQDGDIDDALEEERRREAQLDREYWAPLRRELEALRHASRKR